MSSKVPLNTYYFSEPTTDDNLKYTTNMFYNKWRIAILTFESIQNYWLTKDDNPTILKIDFLIKFDVLRRPYNYNPLLEKVQTIAKSHKIRYLCVDSSNDDSSLTEFFKNNGFQFCTILNLQAKQPEQILLKDLY